MMQPALKGEGPGPSLHQAAEDVGFSHSSMSMSDMMNHASLDPEKKLPFSTAKMPVLSSTAMAYSSTCEASAKLESLNLKQRGKTSHLPKEHGCQ